MNTNPKCSGCKRYFEPKIKSSGLPCKTCEICRQKKTKSRHNNKCEHNRIKSICKECGGSQICTHNHQKNTCKKCGGSQICSHNRDKSYCKECGGSQICGHNRIRSVCKECGGSQICEHNREKSVCKECCGSKICEHNRIKSVCKECGDVLFKTINTFMKGSYAKDKKYNRLDIVNFIDRDFCKLLIEESNNKCCYCDCDLELIHYGDNLITIERIDNTIGHIKSNVKIACLKCNFSRVGDKL